MKLRVLGCSGGIGGSLRTTTFLVDDDILIDAGTGVNDLSLEEMARINHVFVTHSHLDHITSIPFMVDTVGWMRNRPLVVHALAETIEILKNHLFNWKLWPDFTQIPNSGQPYMEYSPLTVGSTVAIDDRRRITPLPANHVVPAVGYRLDSGDASLVFTGDTTTNDQFWPYVNNIENLRYLVIETAFGNSERELAEAAKHLCPSLLVQELAKLTRAAQIYVTHLKPGGADVIMREIIDTAAQWRPQMLQHQQVFEF